jgi:hypothetical protein
VISKWGLSDYVGAAVFMAIPLGIALAVKAAWLGSLISAAIGLGIYVLLDLWGRKALVKQAATKWAKDSEEHRKTLQLRSDRSRQLKPRPVGRQRTRNRF